MVDLIPESSEGQQVDSRPIFIVGQAHSGKTPLRIALEQHPDLSIERRAYAWLELRGRFGDLKLARNRLLLFKALMADPLVARLVADPEGLRAAFEVGPGRFDALIGLVHEHHIGNIGKTRWGIQLGFAELISQSLLEVFPGGSIVHMVREPSSQLSFGGRDPISVGWRTGKWIDSTLIGLQLQDDYPSRYRIVRYEDLRNNAAATLAEICEFVDLACLPAMVAVLENGVESKQNTHQHATGSDRFIDGRAGALARQLGYLKAKPTRGIQPIQEASLLAWRLAAAFRARRRGYGAKV